MSSLTVKQIAAIALAVAVSIAILIGLIYVAKPANYSKDKERGTLEPTVGVTKSATHVDIARIKITFDQYSATLPTNRRISICAGYGCKSNQSLVLPESLKQQLIAPFRRVSNPEQERQAISEAIIVFEHYVGSVLGTSKDRRGADLFGIGDRTQMDSVDEALNTTSLLLWLHANGQINYHDISAPSWKLWYALTYFTAVVIDTSTTSKWAIDSSVNDNGKPPQIVKLDQWAK